MKKISDEDTYNAKVDIVTYPNNIKNYSEEREDYTELALTAIKQKADVIQYISPSYKDYSILCEEAINQNFRTFLLIKDSASNYKKLGKNVIKNHPFLVEFLSKKAKYYSFFWKLAISRDDRVLWYIHESKKELFPLIEKKIQQNPLAISFVDRGISIYSKLCNIAYNKNKESITCMNINCVDKNLVFEIIHKEPKKIKYLDRNKDYYKEAQKFALSLNGQLIKSIHSLSIEDNLDYFFELIDIAVKNSPEIVDYPIVIKVLCLENRRRKMKLLNTPNILGNGLYNLLNEIDEEYKLLSEEYSKALLKEIEKNNIHSNPTSDCSIVKLKVGK